MRQMMESETPVSLAHAHGVRRRMSERNSTCTSEFK